jgi:hypothetical protein
MKALFDEIKGQYQSALAELPDLGSHFIATDARKPAISKFGDMYHVTIDHSVGKKVHLRGLSSSRNDQLPESSDAGGAL